MHIAENPTLSSQTEGLPVWPDPGWVTIALEAPCVSGPLGVLRGIMENCMYFYSLRVQLILWLLLLRWNIINIIITRLWIEKTMTSKWGVNKFIFNRHCFMVLVLCEGGLEDIAYKSIDNRLMLSWSTCYHGVDSCYHGVDSCYHGVDLWCRHWNSSYDELLKGDGCCLSWRAVHVFTKRFRVLPNCRIVFTLQVIVITSRCFFFPWEHVEDD